MVIEHLPSLPNKMQNLLYKTDRGCIYNMKLGKVIKAVNRQMLLLFCIVVKAYIWEVDQNMRASSTVQPSLPRPIF